MTILRLVLQTSPWLIYEIVSQNEKEKLRPDLFDLMFHRSIPNPFQRVEENNNIIKGKTGKILHENTKCVGIVFIFENLFSVSPNCSCPFLVINIQVDPRKKKSIEACLKQIITVQSDTQICQKNNREVAIFIF